MRKATPTPLTDHQKQIIEDQFNSSLEEYSFAKADRPEQEKRWAGYLRGMQEVLNIMGWEMVPKHRYTRFGEAEDGSVIVWSDFHLEVKEW